MTAMGTNNHGGDSVLINVDQERDEYPFIVIDIRGDETGREISNVLIETEREADEFLNDVINAVRWFKAALAAQ